MALALAAAMALALAAVALVPLQRQGYLTRTPSNPRTLIRYNLTSPSTFDENREWVQA